MIKLSDIQITYDNKTVVDDFSCSVSEKEKLVLTGSSGSGKSSILKSVFGFVPISQGEIKIHDEILSKNTLSNLRSQIFYLHQEPQFHAQTVWESIAMVYQFESNKQIGYSNQKITRLFKECNLEASLLKQDIQNLSGGEKQRVGIAIGKMLKRPIWLLDEPVSALDPDNKELIANLLSKQDATMLIVSHDDVWKNKNFTLKSITHGGN